MEALGKLLRAKAWYDPAEFQQGKADNAGCFNQLKTNRALSVSYRAQFRVLECSEVGSSGSLSEREKNAGGGRTPEISIAITKRFLISTR